LKTERDMDLNHLYRQSRGESLWVRWLMPVLAVLWLGELVVPVSDVLRSQLDSWSIALALVGAGVFVAAYVWVAADAVRLGSGVTGPPHSQFWTWLPPAILAVLATLLAATGGAAWLVLFIFAAVACGLRLPTRDAAWAIAGLTLLAGCIGWLEGLSPADLAQGGLLIAGIGASVAIVGYTVRVTRELRQARADVARLAITEERLRLARDLHDLLGHSLSLVALKCDLAEHLVDAAPERARGEIREAASVTRQALREVRDTVAGFRRPTLAGELSAAREMLAAAGIGCHVDADGLDVPSHLEPALAWAVREGVTNVIRHSRAQRCVVELRRDAESIRLDIVDDGDGASNLTAGGNGLRGLAERLAAVGGGCDAHAGDPRGFRLSAWVPLHADAGAEVRGSGRGA
jgi:two-component system sensor histidine kinase DesK